MVRLKIPLISFRIHPKYDKFCRYDIAVATFDKDQLLKDCGRGLKESFWRNVKRQIPKVGRGQEQQRIEIVGHTLNGAQLVSKGKGLVIFV